MSLKIRLAKIGKKNAPAYKVVVAQTKSKRNGKFLDLLGDFNPTTTGKSTMGGKAVINKEKLDEWVKKGALITEPVKQMLEGTYKYVKYNPKAEKASKDESDAVENKSDGEIASATPRDDDVKDGSGKEDKKSGDDNNAKSNKESTE